MSCQHVKDPESGLWVHIPGCYAAIHDPECCTCAVKGSDLENAIADKERAEAKARHAIASAQQTRQRNTQLLIRNADLRRRIAALKNQST